MNLWTFTIREVRSRPGRATLTMFSVVLGVAAVVSMTTASSATRRAYADMYQAMAGRAAFEVVAEGGAGYDQAVMDELQRIHGVAAAVPVLQRPTVLLFPGDRVQVMLLAIDPQKDQATRDYKLAEGEFFHQGTGILLEQGFAKSVGLQVGDDVKLLVSGRRGFVVATVVGLLAPQGAAAFSQGGMVFLPLPIAQKLFKVGDVVDATHLVLSPDADASAVEAEVAGMLPPGLRVQRPAARTELADRTLASSEQGLRLATALSMVVALFIIFNTFLMNVGERRRQLAVMRAIGATRRQIAGLMLGEGLALGVAGTIPGIVLGLIGAHYLTGAMAALFNASLPPTRVAVGPLVLGAVFGIVVSLLGVYVPARQAGRVSPLEGMGAVSAQDREGPSIVMTLAALGLALVTSLLLLATIRGWIPADYAVWTAVVFMLSVVLVAPALTGPLALGLAPLLRPALRFEGRLARLQLLRRKMRTGLTVGVLCVAIGAGIGLCNVTSDNIRDIHGWYHSTFTGNFYVRAMMPDLATGSVAGMPDEFGDDLRRIPGVKNVDNIVTVRVDVQGETAMVLAAHHEDGSALSLALIDGESDEIRRRLKAGEIVVSTVLARRLGIGRGDTVEIATPQGPQPFHVAGTSNDYAFGGVVLHMDLDTARSNLGVEDTHAFAVTADPRHKVDIERQLRDMCREEGFLLQSNADIERLVNQMVDGLTGSMYVLLALGFIVAAFGIVNTLTMNVLEQTREIGLLRTVAMTRWQVRKLILSQAVILGLIGLGPGTLTGLAVSYLMNLCNPAVQGHYVPFMIRPSLLLGSFSAALLIVVASALLPAERAARLDLRTAMQME